MVLKPDGSKYACQSCLKGHRVSACTHVERELIFVPKKGRPVTQCQHCRQERKKRSAHVKCDCGETEKPHHPREKCIHLREAEERAKAGLHDEPSLVERDSAHLAVAEEQGCCCHHGGKCTCTIVKKEADHDSSIPHGPAVKPRLEKTSSDSSITVFSNGHHKPIHRKNHAAHECGMPYKMPLPRSLTDHNVTAPAHRSADNLLQNFPNTTQAAPLIPLTVPDLTSERKVSSSDLSDFSGVQIDLAGLAGPQSSGINDLSRTQTNPSVQSATSEPMGMAPYEPMSGIVDESFDPWSAYPSGDSNNLSDNGLFTGWSLPMNDLSAPQPALTAGSSGTQSEADENPAMDDVYSFGMPSIQEDIVGANSDFSGVSAARSRRSLPAGFFGNLSLAVPDVNGDWRAMNTDAVQSTGDVKPKIQANTQFSQYDDAWQGVPQGVPQHQLGSQSSINRPTSQSVGPQSTSGDEIIRQLFPDFDIDGSVFGSGVTGSPTGMHAGEDPTLSMATSAMDINQMEMGTMDNAGFTQQSWSDGSVSIPNDSYSPNFDYSQAYCTPDMTGTFVQ